MNLERTYRPGDYVYLANDKVRYVYFVKSGKVGLKFDYGHDFIFSVYEAGEIFGEIEVLAKLNRISSAQVLANTTLILLSEQEYKIMCYNNPRLFYKSFFKSSEILKSINDIIVTKVSPDEDFDRERKIYSIGNYFHKSHQITKALYVFKKYVQLFPEGKFINEVKSTIKELEEKYDAVLFGAGEADFKRLIMIAEKEKEASNFLRVVEIYKYLLNLNLTPEEIVMVLFKLCETYLEMDKPLLALRTIMKVSEYLSDDFTLNKANYYQGVCHYRLKNYEKAKEFLEKVTTSTFKQKAIEILKQIEENERS